MLILEVRPGAAEQLEASRRTKTHWFCNIFLLLARMRASLSGRMVTKEVQKVLWRDLKSIFCEIEKCASRLHESFILRPGGALGASKMWPKMRLKNFHIRSWFFGAAKSHPESSGLPKCKLIDVKLMILSLNIKKPSKTWGYQLWTTKYRASRTLRTH